MPSFEKRLIHTSNNSVWLSLCGVVFFLGRSTLNNAGNYLFTIRESERELEHRHSSAEMTAHFKDHFAHDTLEHKRAPAVRQQSGSNDTAHDREEERSSRPTDVVYGLLHMAKTAGTTINGELAMHYEKVCGNKGFSHDYYQLNVRKFDLASKQAAPSRRLYNAAEATAVRNATSHVQKHHNIHSHGHFSLDYMKEIGFADCDYLANEVGSQFWAHRFGRWHKPLELHVPCRDPIDILLSMCNYRQLRFTCQEDFTEELHACLKGESRFKRRTLTHRNIHMKCFRSPHKVQAYLDYMGERLQKKEVSSQYVQRDSNIPRKKEEECLAMRENYTYKVRVVQYLTRETEHFKDYFEFCRDCIHSEDELVK